jgi:shikimate kinase
MKVFLVGYMCSGKSTLGGQLASKLNVPFFDLDKEVERSSGKSIANIFTHDGESTFRQLEKKELNKIIKSHTDFVLATGGGTPCSLNNMDIMKKNGLTIFLSVPVRELVRRNLNSTELRPLLRGLNELEMLAFINEHLQQRLPYYKKASLTLKENDQDIERLVQDVKLMTHSR